MYMYVYLRFQLKFSVYGLTYVRTYVRRQTDIHTHASCNAVTLVWGSLRLAPINYRTAQDHTYFLNKVNIMILLLLQEKAPCVNSCDGSSMNSSIPKALGRWGSREYKAITYIVE